MSRDSVWFVQNCNACVFKPETLLCNAIYRIYDGLAEFSTLSETNSCIFVLPPVIQAAPVATRCTSGAAWPYRCHRSNGQCLEKGQICLDKPFNCDVCYKLSHNALKNIEVEEGLRDFTSPPSVPENWCKWCSKESAPMFLPFALKSQGSFAYSAGCSWFEKTRKKERLAHVALNHLKTNLHSRYDPGFHWNSWLPSSWCFDTFSTKLRHEHSWRFVEKPQPLYAFPSLNHVLTCPTVQPLGLFFSSLRQVSSTAPSPAHQPLEGDLFVHSHWCVCVCLFSFWKTYCKPHQPISIVRSESEYSWLQSQETRGSKLYILQVSRCGYGTWRSQTSIAQRGWGHVVTALSSENPRWCVSILLT